MRARLVAHPIWWTYQQKDRLQMTHAKDIGYELQSSLLVNAQNGLPLSVIAQNLVSAQGHGNRASMAYNQIIKPTWTS